MIRHYIPLLIFIGFIAASGFLLYAIWSYINDGSSGKGNGKGDKSGPIREPSVDWDRAEGPTLLVSDGREFLLSPADQELLKTGATNPAEFEKQYFTNEKAFK
jgi:hypothetical protein